MERLSRDSYILFLIILTIFNILIGIIDVSDTLFYFIVLIEIPIIIYKTSERFRDINKPGWYGFLGLLPIIPIILCFIDGSRGKNDYGNDPLNRPNSFSINNRLNKKFSKKNIDSTNYYEKTRLIEIARKEGLLTEDEYKYKISVLNEKIDNQNNITNTINDFHKKKSKLDQLKQNGLLNENEYLEKVLELEANYSVNSLENFNLNESNYYYLMKGKEFGPITFIKLKQLLDNEKIDSNCFVRIETERFYEKRIYQLFNKL